MDDALEQRLAGQALAQRLDHVVHEIDHELAFLGDLLLLLLQPVGHAPRPVNGQQHGERTKDDTKDEDQKHGRGIGLAGDAAGGNCGFRVPETG